MPHFNLAVTAASHPPPEHTLSPRYVNFLNVSTSSHTFSSCSTASPIFPSHFLHVKCLENIGHPFSPAHLPWIDLPHCTHNTELAFILKLQIPYGSTSLLDIPSFVRLLTITVIFPMLTSKQLLSKASFHFKNLTQVPWSSHSSWLSHQHTATHLVHPLWQIQWQLLPPLQKENVTAQILGASPYNLKLLWQFRIHSDPCLCSLIHTHHWSNQNFW